MKKKDFITLIMSTVGGILFALGMCMALLPEWLEIRRKSYDKMDFFDHSWRHSIGRTSNRREVFCSQT